MSGEITAYQPVPDATKRNAPMKLHEFDRYPLTFRTEPVHHQARLSQHPRRRPGLGQARGRLPGLAYGGNKVRKMEYIVPTPSPGADTWSRSAAISPTTRQVARSPPTWA